MNKKQKHRTINSYATGISLPLEVLQQVDSIRKDIPRSRFLLRIIENNLKVETETETLQSGLGRQPLSQIVAGKALLPTTTTSNETESKESAAQPCWLIIEIVRLLKLHQFLYLDIKKAKQRTRQNACRSASAFPIMTNALADIRTAFSLDLWSIVAVYVITTTTMMMMTISQIQIFKKVEERIRFTRQPESQPTQADAARR